MKRIIIITSRFIVPLFIILFIISKPMYSQNSDKKHSIELQFFTSFGLEKESHLAPQTVFNIKRSLLVYKYKINKNFSLSLAGDTYLKDKNKTLALTPYLKRAYIQYKNKKMTVKTGLIVLEQFKYERGVWNLRYIDKIFQNKFGYGDNRNTGALVKYKYCKMFSYDFALTTGYSTPIEKYEENFLFSAGQTFNFDFFTIRLFNSVSLNSNPEHTSSVFFTKKINKTRIGLELASQIIYSSNPYLKQSGGSFFLTQQLPNNFMGFFRFDANFNKENMENQTCLGLQYSLKESLMFSIYAKSIDFESSLLGLSLFYHFV